MAKQKNVRIISGWIGYSDDKPFKFTNEGLKEWSVYRTRADARKAFNDVRRVDLVIREDKRG